MRPSPRAIARLTAWLLLGLLALAASPSRAGVVSGVDLIPSGRTTRLILSADSPLSYQVELSDPQTVVLRLAGITTLRGVPATAADPLIRSLQVRPYAAGTELVVRTRTPGITVLPFYDAASRRLTLELGGPGAVEVKADASETGAVSAAAPAPADQARAPMPAPAATATQPPAAPATQPPAATPTATAPTTTSAPTTSQPPAPAPAASAAPAITPPPAATPTTTAPTTTQPPAKAPAATQPPAKAPAPAAPPVVQTPAPKPSGPPVRVTKVRLGSHPEFTRLVVEAEAPLDGGLRPLGAEAILDLGWSRLDPGVGLPRPDARVLDLAVASPQPLELILRLAGPLGRHKIFYLDGGRKLVLDLTTLPPGAEPPAPAPRPQAAPAAPPAPVAQAAPAAPPAPVAQAAPAAPPAELPQPDLVAPGRVMESNPALARGAIPPLPPPGPTARPRELPHASAPDLGQAPPSTEETIAQLRRRQENRERVAQPMPPEQGLIQAPPAPQRGVERVGERPPQGGPLGPGGVMDGDAQALFARAKLDFDTRRYSEAYAGFDQFLMRFPDHRLAAEAAYRRADAFMKLNERRVTPVFWDLMEQYQYALDRFPDSDQAPWALLMMGKASALFGESFRAQGYYDLVIQDHPQSQYASLAMVERGQTFLSEQDYNRALEEYRRIVERHPDSRFRKDAEWGMVQAYFGLLAHDRAAALLEQMLARNPRLYLEEPEILYHLGEAQFQLRKYPEARANFLWVLNLKPDIRDNDIILARVGDTYQYEGQYKTAQDVFKQVVNLYPESDGALVARIRLAESPEKDSQHPWDIFQVKATTDALNTYRELAEKYANRAVGQLAQLKLGVYFYKMGQHAQSIAALEKLLQDHPRTPFKREVDYTLNLASLGLLDHLRQAGKPMELMNAYLRHRPYLQRPNGSDILKLLAWAYEKTGQNDRAARTYRVLISRGLNEPTLAVDMARNLMIEGDHQGVINGLAPPDLKALQGADLRQAWSLLGRALALRKQWLPAVITLEQLIKTPGEPPAGAADYAAYGRALWSLGRLDPALAALDQADRLLEREPGQAAGQERHLLAMDSGAVASQAEKYRESEGYFRKAVVLAGSGTQQAQALYQLAQAARLAGDSEEVLKVLAQLVQLKVDPWSSMAQRLLADLDLAPRLAQVGN